MLAQIVIDNFRSFKYRTVIDLTRTQYAALANTNTHEGIVKGLAFVGGNASGKSNILLAIRLLLDLLFKEREIDNPMFLCFFGDSKEFSIEYTFKIDDVEIKYTIRNNVMKKILTERLLLDNDEVLVRMGSGAESEISGSKKLYSEKEVAPTTLFLRTIFFNTGFAGNEILKKWFRFLQNSVYYNAFERTSMAYGNQKVGAFSFLEEKGPEGINKFFEKHGLHQRIEYAKELESGGGLRISLDEGKMPFFKREDCKIAIPYHEESLGNQLLLHFLPCYFATIDNSGMLLVDEFSSGFHNDLETLLIKEWMKTAEESQLLIVTHSTNLLSTALLRPDQIYSVSFADGEGSRVKRFSEEGPRVAQNLEKMYRSGVFGGVPEYVQD